MPSGGPRQGQPGKAYPNRSDMNANRALPKQTVPGQQYGKQAEQARSMAAVPMAPPPSPVAPGSLPALDAPTMRPDEPVTAGAAMGPGPGMEAIGSFGTSELDEIRSLYRLYPSNELREIIEELEEEEGGA